MFYYGEVTMFSYGDSMAMEAGEMWSTRWVQFKRAHDSAFDCGLNVCGGSGLCQVERHHGLKVRALRDSLHDPLSVSNGLWVGR
jgi:hypothetical protein